MISHFHVDKEQFKSVTVNNRYHIYDKIYNLKCLRSILFCDVNKLIHVINRT